MGLATDVDGYSPERLESLLREGKVTQQSIQGTSHWMLEHRAFLRDMAAVWTRELRAGDAALQVVALYVANDAMQVGARRFGRHVAAAFEPELLGVAEFVMQSCDEKVKRCLLKVVGIWKQRRVVTPELLQMLENVCAGRPAVDPTAAAAAADVAPDAAAPDHAEDRDAALAQMLSDEAVEQALEELPEVAESDFTVATTQRLQSFSSATISADLLSDRMFQLESSLSNFHQACEAFQSRDAGFEVVGASAGDIVWEAMEQQVFDLDVERSRDHVQQYRLNLEEQAARREELLGHLTQLSEAELFPEPLFAAASSSMDALEEQRRALEKLFFVCADAEAIEKKREAEKQAAYMESYRGRRGSEGGERSSYDFDAPYRSSPSSSRSSFSHHRGDAFSPRYGGSDTGGAPILRRHSSSESRGDRYYGSENRYGAQSKRPKLQHAHSADSDDMARRWGEPSPSHEYRPPSYRDENRYSPRRDFGAPYASSSASYGDRPPQQQQQYQQQRSGRRWDLRPPPGGDFGQRGDFEPRDRRW